MIFSVREGKVREDEDCGSERTQDEKRLMVRPIVVEGRTPGRVY